MPLTLLDVSLNRVTGTMQYAARVVEERDGTIDLTRVLGLEAVVAAVAFPEGDKRRPEVLRNARITVTWYNYHMGFLREIGPDGQFWYCGDNGCRCTHRLGGLPAHISPHGTVKAWSIKGGLTYHDDPNDDPESGYWEDEAKYRLEHGGLTKGIPSAANG